MNKTNLYFIIIIVVIISGGYISGCKEGKSGKEKITIQKKYNRAGVLVSEVSIKDGLKHGPTTNYYENGKIHSVINYEEGKQHGETVWYYESGKPYQITPFVNGKENGIQKKYYESGRLMAEISFRNGQQQPGIKEYTETGNLISDYPDIVFEKPVKASVPNRYTLKLHLSNHSKEVVFQQVVISSTGDTIFAGVPTLEGIGEIPFFVSKGNSTEASVLIMAKTKTKLRNNYVTQGEYHVKIVN